MSKTPDEVECNMRIQALEKDARRIEATQKENRNEIKERHERLKAENQKSHDDMRDALTTVRATLAEKEKNNTSTRDIFVKVAPWFVSGAFGLFSAFILSDLKELEDKLNKASSDRLSWQGKHETVIEHRDTVQCSSTQNLQGAFNNKFPDDRVTVIDCGAGAGE